MSDLTGALERRDRSRWALLGFSVLTIGVGLASVVAFPAGVPLHDGWFTPILAFELARVPADLAFLSGPEAEPVRAAMDAGHRLDMLFPFAYGGLMAVSAWRARPAGASVTAGVCAGVAIVSDLCENAVLVGLTATLRVDGDVLPGLWWLFWATWVKWGAIGLGLGALGSTQGSWIRRGLLGAAACSVPVAALTGWPIAGEGMGLCVILGFLALLRRPGSRAALPPDRGSQPRPPGRGERRQLSTHGLSDPGSAPAPAGLPQRR